MLFFTNSGPVSCRFRFMGRNGEPAFQEFDSFFSGSKFIQSHFLLSGFVCYTDPGKNGLARMRNEN